MSLEVAERASKAVLGFPWVSHEDVLPHSLGPSVLAVSPVPAAATGTFEGNSPRADVPSTSGIW